MNIGGALASGIFAITALTVVGAIMSYTVFKVRERRRKPKASAGDEDVLQFFDEYRPHGSGARANTEEQSATGWGLWARLAASTLGLLVIVGCLVAFLVYSRKQEKTPPEPPSDRTSGMLKRLVSLLEKGEEPKPPAHDRGRQPDFGSMRSRKPSMFPFSSLDRNRDRRIQRHERKQIHQRVPQFVLVTSDDNGSVDGLQWLHEQATTHGFVGQMTFFNTANYLTGRKNHLGGKVTGEWQQLLDHYYVGLHGSTHEEGAEGWDTMRWRKELSSIMGELTGRLQLPKGWTWDKYPFGSRAPFLMLTNTYFEALLDLEHPVLYDASLQVRPGGERRTPHPPRDERRDLVWPFTLDNRLPRQIDRPYLPDTGKRARIERHPFWEVPVYSWYLRREEGQGEWQPSLDVNLWQHHPCTGAGNQAAVEAVLDNLEAHYRGNRAPFHIGLHSRQYAADRNCERATLGAIFAEIKGLKGAGKNIRFSNIPDLLLWLMRRR